MEKKLITIFTAKIYTKNEDFSIVIASDEQAQTKDVVYAFLKKIITWLKIKNPLIKHIIMFSDGCASQFKNKYNFLNLMYTQDDFDVTMEWNFFCTSHGKNECDGLGGTVKRGVHRKAIASDMHVYSAEQFVSSAKTFAKKIEIIEMKPKEILSSTKGLARRWKNAVNISGTQSYHCFRPSTKKGYLNVSMTSSGENFKEFKML